MTSGVLFLNSIATSRIGNYFAVFISSPYFNSFLTLYSYEFQLYLLKLYIYLTLFGRILKFQIIQLTLLLQESYESLNCVRYTNHLGWCWTDGVLINLHALAITKRSAVLLLPRKTITRMCAINNHQDV